MTTVSRPCLTRGPIREYATLERNTQKLAEQVLRILPLRIAFTQWFAASLRFPYAEVPIVSVYSEDVPDAQALAGLGFREVATGGRVWIIVPRDAGVFQAGRVVNDLPVVSDVQICEGSCETGLKRAV